MTWDTVAAALGASLLTGLFAMWANAQSDKTNLRRLVEENKARLSQQTQEYRNQLQKAVIERRTEFRRQRLTPLQDALEKLLALSGRYRHIAGGLYGIQSGDDDMHLPPNPEQRMKETAEEMSTIRSEVLGRYAWLGIGSARLTENIRKLNRDLAILEEEARQYAEMMNAYDDTRKAAKGAYAKLDDLLTETALLVEQLISGEDLVSDDTTPASKANDSSP
ncbi:MAG: hypothetical protein HY681_09680 [Chloroflexi bacterium]|nr:hypothetical protein [Chloroflexota bacterium]